MGGRDRTKQQPISAAGLAQLDKAKKLAEQQRQQQQASAKQAASNTKQASKPVHDESRKHT